MLNGFEAESAKSARHSLAQDIQAMMGHANHIGSFTDGKVVFHV